MTTLFGFILLQAGEGGGESSGNAGLINILFLAGLFLVFYLFMIRPQMQKQKKERKFRENLEKGSKVVTISGLYGKITQLDEKSVLLEVDKDVKLRVERAAIRGYQPGNDQE